MAKSIESAVIGAAETLSQQVGALRFAPPTVYVYNPLDYAWPGHRSYLARYGGTRKKTVFLGMNPGPFGMAQTGIPFGEVAQVRDWLGIEETILKPRPEHPKRPIEGFRCQRSEVSGRRLWGLFESRFGAARMFFKDHFVANYCPLVFMEDSGRNRTPDKLPSAEAEALYLACDTHLRDLVAVLQPDWVIGVGAFAEKRAVAALGRSPVRIGKILHPSPASPAANRGWAAQATRQLEALGVW